MKDFNSVKNLVTQLRFILSKNQRIQVIGIYFLILFGSLGDLLGISAIIPFVQAISDKESFVKLTYINKIISTFGISEDLIIIFLALAIIVLYIVKNAIMLIVNYEQFRFGRTVERDISILLFSAYMHENYEYHLNHSSGEAMRGITHDTNGVYETIRNLLSLLANLTSILLIVIFLVIINPYLAFGTLAIGLSTFCVVTFLSRSIIKGLGEKTRIHEAEKNKYALQGIKGVKEILVNKSQEWFVNGYSNAFEKFTKIQCQYGFAVSFPNRLIETICVCVLILFVSVNASRAINISGLISELAAFALAAFRILPMLGTVIESINALAFNRVRVESVYNSLKNITCENKVINNDIGQVELFNRLTLEDIYFSYEGSEKNIIDGISMEINRGQMIGIIGESGAGKTTLVDVILGLLIPTSGRILIDGEETDGDRIASMVGYVPQEVFVVDDTIKRNIAFGIPDDKINDEKIESVITDAQLSEYLDGLPEKEETVVGECGSRMSGGQRQRIAIARALYKSPQILVFDEATSALDNATEKSVMESINMLHGKITMIIIAHRLSTIEQCDVVYRIENGKAIKMYG